MTGGWGEAAVGSFFVEGRKPNTKHLLGPLSGQAVCRRGNCPLPRSPMPWAYSRKPNRLLGIAQGATLAKETNRGPGEGGRPERGQAVVALPTEPCRTRAI